MYVLVHATARQRAIEGVRDAPDGYVVTIKPPTRTVTQNSHIHPVVKDIALAAKRPTDKESLQTLRYLLLEQWRSETGRNPVFERSLDGMRWVQVTKGTSELDKPECSEFIEWMTAFLAQYD